VPVEEPFTASLAATSRCSKMIGYSIKVIGAFDGNPKIISFLVAALARIIETSA
jgi:hypothetical protein